MTNKEHLKNNMTAKNIMNDEEALNKFLDWNTFYRRNLHRFVETYLGLEMHLYQIIILYIMNLAPTVVIVAARAASKSFIIAVFSCARCILYPGTMIVIASSTKKQASLIVSEKIKKELMPKSHNLRREIKEIKAGMNETEVFFHNGSSIVVVPATENARGYRCNILIYEEFRMIKKSIIDAVLSPFLAVRNTGYKKNCAELKEEPIEIYISSAYFASHWMSKIIKDTVKDMYNKSESIFLSFDYSITLRHEIRTKKQLIKEKKKLGTMAFAMEYGNEMVGQSDNPFFTFDKLDKIQILKKVFYTKDWLARHDSGKKSKNATPKMAGEIRVLSADIAMINKEANDNTVLTCIRALPSGSIYERQVPLIEAFKGDGFTGQALRIKQLFYDFEADYIVLDTQGTGISVFEQLGKITCDEERGTEYPAFTCFNDKSMAATVKNREALPVIFSYKGNLELNQAMHYAMVDAIDNKKIKLLLNSSKASDYLEEQAFYSKTESIEEKVDFEIPYVQTDLLINEMVNLKQVIKQLKYTALEEPSTGTKDRYISLAMGNYFIKKLEDKLSGDDDEEEDDLSYEAVSEIEWTL